MTVNDLVAALAAKPWLIASVFFGIPLFASLYGKAHGAGRGRETPHRYIYALLVYVSCVPGMFVSVLLAYMLFFLRANLMEVNVLVYFLPLLSMIVTVAIIRRSVELADIPGFDRLAGLMVLLAVTFGVTLAIMKTRIWVMFGGSLWALLLLALVVFGLLQWASRKVMGGESASPDRVGRSRG